MQISSTTARYIVLAAVFVGLVGGVAAGVGLYTFVYARGASYLTNDPAACDNCHVMNEQYDGWVKSSHHGVAVCNDCHTPHTFFAKYRTKALNGYHHGWAFTTGHFKEPIQITQRNHEITEAACRGCHRNIVNQIDSTHEKDRELQCTTCHVSVGHLH